MKNMTLEKIAESCRGTYYGSSVDATREVQGVVIDSRKVEQDYLFVAIKGEKVDGHQFIKAVYEQGALCVISQQKLEGETHPYILVESTEQALKDIAAFYRESLGIKVVGVTGSVGKTSTKEMIASVLSQKYNVLKTAGNFNNEIGLPLTVFNIRQEHEVAVLEMGISDFNEMHRLGEVAKPDLFVMTNIGLCHLENLKTRDGILKAKTEAFDHMRGQGTVILNGDDDKLSTVVEVNGKAPIFYGMQEFDPEDETVGCNQCRRSAYADQISHEGLEGIGAVLHLDGEEITVNIPIPGEHNVMNALAAACVGRELGLSVEQIKDGIEAVQTLSGHSNLIHCKGLTIMDDCYNANPVSMRASLDVLSRAKGRKIAVLGDMGELGTDEAQLHYGLGQDVEERQIGILFAAGPLSENMVKALRDMGSSCEVHWFETRDELIPELTAYVREGDTILVKASHFMGFPKIVEALEQ